MSYHVYVPEAYEQLTDQRFPVLYWLHGSGGGLGGISYVAGYFDEAIRAGKIPPMLVVFPNGFAASMWCDSKDGWVPMETVVVKELVPQVDGVFRTVAGREGRLIEGFSMGGYGAARWGLKYPEVFATLSILAGVPLDLELKGPRATANAQERQRILDTVYGNDMEYFQAQSPWKLAERHADKVRGKTRARIVVGDRDNTMSLNREFSKHIIILMIFHAFTLLPATIHDTKAVLGSLGERNWEFYRSAFGAR